MRTPPDAAIDSYYRAAALGLRLLEAREARGRRFEEAAAATWRALGGELEDRGRLDLLLRDAAVSNPLAFSARGVFDLAWLTDDERRVAPLAGRRRAGARGGRGARQGARQLMLSPERVALQGLTPCPHEQDVIEFIKKEQRYGEAEAQALGKTLDDLRAWRPAGRRGSK